MIDFRYHLVSLISVFLALAVGIALGAGPLKETIGDSLTGQVSQLREEKDALRVDLDDAAAEAQWTESALDAASDDLIGGILGDRRVALIQVGAVSDQVRNGVVDRLEQAGGTVTGTVQVTEAWTDPEQQTFRQSLAGTLLDYLDPVPGAQSGSELAEALAQSLTASEPADPDVRSERAGILLDLLREGGLVATTADITAPADLVVVLAGPVLDARTAQVEAQAGSTAAPELVEQSSQQRAELEAALTRIGLAAQARSGGAVVVSGAPVEQNVLLPLRRVTGFARTVSTVDSAETTAGRIAVPMALAARVEGGAGHFGRGPQVDAPLPARVELAPVVRVTELDPDLTADPGGDVTPTPGADSTEAPAEESNEDGQG